MDLFLRKIHAIYLRHWKKVVVFMVIGYLLFFYDYGYEKQDTKEKTELKQKYDFLREYDPIAKKQSIDSPAILLVTYLRSGSTLVGDMIQQLPQVFYNYEPVKSYLEQDRYLSFAEGECMDSSIKCRYDDKAVQLCRKMARDFQYFLTCNFTAMDPYFMWNHKKSLAISELKRCVDNPQIHSCFQKSVQKCKESIRVIKTIRISMDFVHLFMKTIPNLKVVHLLRDPRSMINSRHIMHFVKKSMVVSDVAKAVCQRYLRDLEISKVLQGMYPNKIKTFLYEKIAENPYEQANRLFTFLSLPPPDNFKDWLWNHTFAGVTSKPFETIRANATETSYFWRLTMPFEVIQVIDRECLTLYKHTGHIPVSDEQTLRDINIPLYERTAIFED